jgi:two-component system, LytTR family, response regulator
MPHKLNALIVDDEVSARNLLNQLLIELKLFKEIKQARSVSSAVTELNNFDPDIIFLDINMPGRDGFSFIDELPRKKKNPGIVFVTAFDQYAIKAIKNQAFDYLLKPVDRNELRQCVLKFIAMRIAQDQPEETKEESSGKISRIKINTRSGTIFINPSSILYCRADGNYTTICTGEKQHLCSMNLGKVEEILLDHGFIRIGRSHIINPEYVTMLDRRESTLTIEREGESVKLKIPRQHLKDLDKI